MIFKKSIPLSEAAEIIRGVSFQRGEGKSTIQTNHLPVVRAGNIQDELNLNKDLVWVPQKKISKKQQIKKDDLIMCTSSGSAEIVGKCARSECDWQGSFGAFCVGIRARQNICDAAYLFYYLRSPIFKNWSRNSSGANIKNIRKSELEEFIIPLPPLLEQRRISAILEKADAIRHKRQQAIKLANEFLRATFLDMFGDPVTNPKGWGVKRFGEIGTLDRGVSKHRPRNAPELLGGPYPLIQTGDVANSGGYIRNYKSTYSEIGLKQSKIWPKGTLCITIAANIAKTGIMTFGACFPDSVVGFTPNLLSTTEYVQFWLSFLQKILEEKAPESAQKNINLNILRNLDAPLPPIDLQKKFSFQVGKVETLKEKQRVNNHCSSNLFNCLTQRAFRGEI